VERAFVSETGTQISQTAAESLPHWPKLWWPLCAMAAVVMVIFIVAFKSNVNTQTDEAEHGS
jgi:hypothetical protein